MSKTTKKSFAEQGLEEVQEAAKAVEEEMTSVDTTTQATGDDEALEQIGGLEPVAFFYRFTPPKAGKEPKQPWKILPKDTVIDGKFERSFITGSLKTPTHLIRMPEGTPPTTITFQGSTQEVEVAGKLIGVPGAGNGNKDKGPFTGFNKAMDQVAPGSKVKIVYQGMAAKKSGDWAGNDCHNFLLYASKRKA